MHGEASHLVTPTPRHAMLCSPALDTKVSKLLRFLVEERLLPLINQLLMPLIEILLVVVKEIRPVSVDG
jgi:hypothetical protein